MADKEEMVKEVTGYTVKQIEGDQAYTITMIMEMAQRIWKLEARVAKMEGRL